MPDLHLVGLPDPGHAGRPRAMALQAIELMRALVAHGKPVAALPPPERPDLAFLRACGCAGDEGQVLAAAPPALLRLACGRPGPGIDGCATVVPAADAADGRLHLVVANRQSWPGRHGEAAVRAEQLRALFPDRQRVAVHEALPALPALADEGGANHLRLATGGGRCHVLVHGRAEGLSAQALPLTRQARQTRAAAEAVARLAGLSAALHVRLHPAAIDAGAEHAALVMTGSRDRLLLHEHAWAGQAAALEELRRMVPGVRTAVVTEQELSLPEAVSCRLFAACLLRTPQGHVLLAPDACAEGRPRRVIDRLLAEGFLAAAGFLALDAGPAALRLRIPLPAADLGLVHPGVLVEPRRLDTLAEWARTCCREQVDDGARADPRLLAESRRALDLLTRLLGLPAGFYPFQRAAVPAASHP